MSKINIGIVGGGIGGIGAAVALHRAGIEAVVYELAPELREVGAGMMLWPNATRVLRDWGLLDQIVALSGSSTRFLVRASNGAILMNIALGDFDVPAVCMRRCDLLNVLLSAVPSSHIRLGHKLADLSSGDKIRLEFADGLIAEHDAVIGADGIRSLIRTKLFGPSEPIYRGYTIWRGIANYEGPPHIPGANSETWGAGRRFGILSIGEDKFTWYAAVSVPKNHVDSRAGRKAELLEVFRGWHTPIADLIDGAMEDQITKNRGCDLAPLKRWSKGRITLLGDSAHPCTPNLGQGGCMALEDAAVLAKCIKQHPTLEAAFHHYEIRRRHRTKHIQQRSRLMGQIAQWENRVIVAGRQVVTTLLPASIFEFNLRRTYSYQI